MEKTKIILSVMFLMLAVICGWWTSSYAEIPHLINYQGRLTDSSGQPIDGARDITFRIFDSENGGIQLWEEAQTGVVVQKGIFSVLLGSVTNLNLAFDIPYYLEIKVGDEVMTPRQKIASAGYAFRAEIAEGVIDGVISKNKLKTDFGEVGSNSDSPLIMPGGEYGFFPQIKGSSAFTSFVMQINGNNTGSTMAPLTYSTCVYISDVHNGWGYARQRYVTASGRDYWLFLLLDKNTKNIISAYAAPDHPSYGNGGDPDKTPHPFANYDSNKQEIVIADKATVAALKEESARVGKSILELVQEEYKPNFAREEKYVPLHTGKFLTQDGKQVMQMVEKLPDYIKIRSLVALTPAEKAEKKAQALQAQQAFQLEQQKMAQEKTSAVDKLKALGLSEDEVKAIKNL
jgi:hypothetical protein